LGAIAHEPDPDLAVQVGPLRLAGPVGLAAGLDKDAEAVPVWPALGFGFVEVGTVTPRPQDGNPRPRMFRLKEERALINRMGFNNGGVEAMRIRLQTLREAGRWPSVPVGANIGKNKDTPNDEAERDYLQCVVALSPLVDYFTVNVSSPNTPGLRALQEPERLSGLLETVIDAARPRPVFLKLAPDLEPSALAEAVDVAVQADCTGIIATNTTISRPGSTGRLDEGGGMSGAPLWPLASERVGQVIDAAAGRVPVIGVGGIHTVEQVEELLERGCHAVQIYSGFIFEGPGLPSRLHRELHQRRTARPVLPSGAT
ncbi:MAG: quinone-dependent dihydroorotate dehydrogenase, partial [Myxococcota bacterium]|nr:quinone-dependent dihydroorotate dehydrogenase [Myxococcota bacterium]